MSMHLPSSVSLLARAVPSGRNRNIGFSCLGLSMPLGFSFGLVLGGVMVDTIGWRVGFYIPGVLTTVLALLGLWSLPKQDSERHWTFAQLWTDIDWTGAVLASSCLALFSYVLAMLSTDASSMKRPTAIVLLVLSLALGAMFPWWMNRQGQLGRPALVPNSLWKNMAFTTICVLVLLSWAVMNSMELFSSLFFQEVQQLSALQASLRLTPALVVGTVLNLSTGILMDKLPVAWLVPTTSLLAAGAPLLMAIAAPSWPYWYATFFAQALEPAGAGVLFTVGLVVVSDEFPEKTQALAGAVFNTVSNFGITFGMSIMQTISMLVTKEKQYRGRTTQGALLQGYRASFWAMFGMAMACCVVGGVGLRRIGRVGLKRE